MILQVVWYQNLQVDILEDEKHIDQTCIKFYIRNLKSKMREVMGKTETHVRDQSNNHQRRSDINNNFSSNWNHNDHQRRNDNISNSASNRSHNDDHHRRNDNNNNNNSAPKEIRDKR